MEAHQRPTSEWEFSHAVSEDDVLVDDWGEEWNVTTVEDSGNVRVRNPDTNERDTWSEEAVRRGLADGTLERKRDSLSAELATY